MVSFSVAQRVTAKWATVCRGIKKSDACDIVIHCQLKFCLYVSIAFSHEVLKNAAGLFHVHHFFTVAKILENNMAKQLHHMSVCLLPINSAPLRWTPTYDIYSELAWSQKYIGRFWVTWTPKSRSRGEKVKTVNGWLLLIVGSTTVPRTADLRLKN